jgi:hypothetical protein
MARTAVEITEERLEKVLQDAKKYDPWDPKAKEMVDSARDEYMGAVQDEELEKARKKNGQ